MDDAVRLCQGLGQRARGQESRPAGRAAGPRRLLHGQCSSRGGQRGQGRPRRPPRTAGPGGRGGHPGGHPHRPALPGADLRAAGDRGPAPEGRGVPVPFGRLRHLDGHRQAPTRDGARLQRVVAQLDQGPLGRRPGEGAGRGAFPRPEAEPDRAAKGLHPGGAVEGSEPAGTGQAPGGQPFGPSSRWTGRGWVGNAASARSMASWEPTQLRFQDPAGERPKAPAAPPRIIAIPIRPSLPPSNGSPADNIQFPSLPCSQLRYSEQSHSSEATGPSARLAPWLPRRSATRLPSPPIRQ